MLSYVNKIILVSYVTLFCIISDHFTKLSAKNLLEPDSVISLFKDTIRLQLANNKGAFLSLGSSFPDEWRFWIFTVFVFIALLALFIYYLFSKSLSFLSTLGLSLIFSGGLSNLIDRILHDGIVVDFLNIGIGIIRTGIINMADITITLGVLLIAFSALVSNRNKLTLIKIFPKN